jgi:hypothetical protein
MSTTRSSLTLYPNETCEYLNYNGGILKGNADISGIGVILAFSLSAYLTFAAVLGAYCFGYVYLGPGITDEGGIYLGQHADESVCGAMQVSRR